MFKTKFQIVFLHGYYAVAIKKWYWRQYRVLAVNNDPYKFVNEESAEYMCRCLEDTEV